MALMKMKVNPMTIIVRMEVLERVVIMMMMMMMMMMAMVTTTMKAAANQNRGWK